MSFMQEENEKEISNILLQKHVISLFVAIF